MKSSGYWLEKESCSSGWKPEGQEELIYLLKYKFFFAELTVEQRKENQGFSGWGKAEWCMALFLGSIWVGFIIFAIKIF